LEPTVETVMPLDIEKVTWLVGFHIHTISCRRTRRPWYSLRITHAKRNPITDDLRSRKRRHRHLTSCAINSYLNVIEKLNFSKSADPPMASASLAVFKKQGSKEDPNVQVKQRVSEGAKTE
jgi:hypothetical protein